MCPSPLCTVACATLTSFCSVPGPDGISVLLSNIRGQKQLVNMLTHAGHGFREAHLGGATRESHVWLPVFEKECVNVTTISSRGDVPLEQILRARGERLENLGIFQHRLSSSEIRSLSMHCKALRKLTIHVTRDCCEQLSDIWANVGKHLEELEIVDGEGVYFKRMFRNVAKYCMRLKAITFSVDEEAVCVAAQLCTDIGARLESASFQGQDISAYVFQTISEGCPNIRMKNVVAMDECAKEVLEAIGPKTHSARIVNDRSLIVVDDALIRVATKCNIMKKISVYLNENQMNPFLRGFLATPKPLLESVSVVFGEFRSCSAHSAVECVSLFSRSDTNLKHFELFAPNVPKGTFSEFVDRNKNLETVSISSPPMTESDDVIELEVSILNEFSKCPYIEDLTLNGPGGFISSKISALEDACIPFRLKGASVYLRYSFYVQ